MRNLPQSLKILVVSTALILGYTAAAPWIRWQACLAEANFHANVIRLQAFLFDPAPRSVIVGSSISGRLLPGYFEGTLLAPVANLGLDGSSPQLGLDLVKTRPPALLLIEENRLMKPWDANDDSLVVATKSLSFRLARFIPILRTRHRPSSVLYTWLKLRRQTEPAGQAFPSPPSPAVLPSRVVSAAGLNPQAASVSEKLRQQIKTQLTAGTRIVLVRIPAGTGDDPACFAMGDQLARDLNLLQLDLRAECARRGVAIQFTDGIHLTPSSAGSVSRVMAELLSARGR